MARRKNPRLWGGVGGDGWGGADPGGTAPDDDPADAPPAGVGAVDNSRMPAAPDREAADRNIVRAPDLRACAVRDERGWGEELNRKQRGQRERSNRGGVAAARWRALGQSADSKSKEVFA